MVSLSAGCGSTRPAIFSLHQQLSITTKTCGLTPNFQKKIQTEIYFIFFMCHFKRKKKRFPFSSGVILVLPQIQWLQDEILWCQSEIITALSGLRISCHRLISNSFSFLLSLSWQITLNIAVILISWWVTGKAWEKQTSDIITPFSSHFNPLSDSGCAGVMNKKKKLSFQSTWFSQSL